MEGGRGLGEEKEGRLKGLKQPAHILTARKCPQDFWPHTQLSWHSLQCSVSLSSVPHEAVKGNQIN